MRNSARRTKIPLWRKIQLEKKRKKVIRLGSLFLLLLFSVFSVKVIRTLVRNLKTPLEDKKCLTERTSIGEVNRVNIVFDNEPLMVFSFDKKETEASVLLIPEDFYFRKEAEVYRLGSFFELGEMRDGCGGRFLKKTLEDFLAVPMDRYVKISNLKSHPEPEQSSVQGSPKPSSALVYGQISNKEGVMDLVKKIRSWGWIFGFLGNFKQVKKDFETDLSFLEIFKLWWGIKDIRLDRISFRNLREGGVALDYELLDGTKVQTVDLNLLHEEVSELFRDSQIEREGVKVEVLNATQKQGLGQKAGLLVTHLGADLVHVGNWPERLEKTQIWLVKKEDSNSYTLQRLAGVFGAEVSVKSEMEEARGNLLLLLGEDCSKSY